MEVVRKVANYAVTKPLREALFAVATVEERYQCKSLIDAFANRLGSSAAALLFASRAGHGLVYGAANAALTLLWGCLCSTLQQERERRAGSQQTTAKS